MWSTYFPDGPPAKCMENRGGHGNFRKGFLPTQMPLHSPTTPSTSLCYSIHIICMLFFFTLSIHINTPTHVYVYIHAAHTVHATRVHTHTQMHTHRHAYTYTWRCAHTHVCAYIHVCTCTHTHALFHHFFKSPLGGKPVSYHLLQRTGHCKQ